MQDSVRHRLVLVYVTWAGTRIQTQRVVLHATFLATNVFQTKLPIVQPAKLELCSVALLMGPVLVTLLGTGALPRPVSCANPFASRVMVLRVLIALTAKQELLCQVLRVFVILCISLSLTLPIADNAIFPAKLALLLLQRAASLVFRPTLNSQDFLPIAVPASLASLQTPLPIFAQAVILLVRPAPAH